MRDFVNRHSDAVAWAMVLTLVGIGGALTYVVAILTIMLAQTSAVN